jgi:hypothetical protein
MTSFSDSGSLAITGNDKDAVVSHGQGWQLVGQQTLHGETYNDYQAQVGTQTVHLLVDTHIIDQTANLS